jgi:PAS domain S-box-containing protein
MKKTKAQLIEELEKLRNQHKQLSVKYIKTLQDFESDDEPDREITDRKLAEEITLVQRDLGIELAAVTGLNDTLRICLEAAIRLSAMDCGGIYLVDQDSGNLDLAYYQGLPEEFITDAFHFDSDSENVRIIKKGKPIYRTHQDLGVQLSSVRNREKLKAMAVVPIYNEGRIIGCLNVASHVFNKVPLSSRASLETITHMIGIAVARARSDHALEESRANFEGLFNSINDLIFILDSKARIIEVNNMVLTTLGYAKNELQYKSVLVLHPEELQDEAAGMVLDVLSAKIDSSTLPIMAKDGTQIPVETKFTMGKWGNTDVILGVSRDITARKRMEEELQKTQKLESIGILAGGIAHDFNNILTGIMGHVSAAKRNSSPQGKNYDMLCAVESASEQAVSLTQQLLTFSTGGEPVKEFASISTLLKEVALFALRGSNVRCEFNLAYDLWPVEVDSGQITQVINNLIINAYQAMPSGGVVAVNAENTVVTNDSIPTLPKGDYIKIEVKDNGQGIAEEFISKVFDPFFTTKKEGSGLGLATSYSIISKHGGLISVESKVDQGTTFTIFLPAKHKIESAKTQEAAGIDYDFTGKRILLMDDEQIVRNLYELILNGCGCGHEIVVNGELAINKYKQAQEANNPFDAVVLDLTIPGGIGGKDVILELKKIDPKVKAIVASGYSNDPVMANYKEYGFMGVIAKPFKPNEFEKILYEVIHKN